MTVQEGEPEGATTRDQLESRSSCSLQPYSVDRTSRRVCERVRTRTLILKSLVLLGNFVNVALDVVVLLPHKLYILGGLLENLRPRSLRGKGKGQVTRREVFGRGWSAY